MFKNWKAWIIPFAITALKNGVLLVPTVSVRNFLKKCVVKILEDISEILTDNDDNNAEQIKQYFADNWKVICKENLIFVAAILREFKAPEQAAAAIEAAAGTF